MTTTINASGITSGLVPDLSSGVARWSGREAQRLTALTLATYGAECHLCHRPGATTADHLIPRSYGIAAGGVNELPNLRPAHLSCNSSRGKKLQTQPVISDNLAFFRATYCQGRPASALLHPDIQKNATHSDISDRG